MASYELSKFKPAPDDDDGVKLRRVTDLVSEESDSLRESFIRLQEWLRSQPVKVEADFTDSKAQTTIRFVNAQDGWRLRVNNASITGCPLEYLIDAAPLYPQVVSAAQKWQRDRLDVLKAANAIVSKVVLPPVSTKKGGA